jgi:heme exporter protein A
VTGTELLRVSGLACARGGVTLLQGLDFALTPGAALVLRGRNGAGKTTLLRTIAGLQPPQAGTLSMASEGLVYAGHVDGVKAVLTVTENLRFWAAIHGTDDIAPALAAMDLRPLADRQARHLSAGQKRRLGLARVLVAGRPLWLLDEPTVSLDVRSVALFAAALRDHLDRGGAALIASHGEPVLPGAPELDLGAHRPAMPRPGAAEPAFAGRAFE